MGDVVDHIGARTHGPLLLFPALIVVAPTGAIPLVPTIMGGLIAIVGLQIILSRQRIWVPTRLKRLEISRDRLEKYLDFVDTWAKRLDWAVRARLASVTEGPFVIAGAIVSIFMGLLMPPLELVPFAAAGPAAVVATLGVGLTAGDGIWVLAGLSLGAVAGVGSAWLLVTVF